VIRLSPGSAFALALVLLCGCGRDENAATTSAGHRAVIAQNVPPYTGTNERGIPNYARRAFTAEDSQLLRQVYGVEDPSRLYVSDSTEDGLLKYDTQVKRCRTCYVNSYRIGFVSVRRPGESWDQLERRVRATPRSNFRSPARPSSSALSALDPDVRADFERMLEDARNIGFVFRVVAAYRSPEREAYLMSAGGGRTHTLTSLHSYGRAIDLTIGDGNLSRGATREQWIAFRRWVTRYKGDEFRILGTPEKSWDWAHVEVPTSRIGFRSIESAISRARECRTSGGCDFQPHLPLLN
jgi:hypothetical protein